MKICRMYISTIVALCLILSPLFTHAQRSRTTETEQEDNFEAQRAGIADAKNDASFPMWYSMGCLFNIFGVGAANLIVPKPSHERLMGKPQEYVWTYSESYKSTRRTLQTRYALFGCLTSGVVMMAAVGFAAAQAEDGCANVDWSCGTDACNDNWDQCNENWSSCNDNWESCGSSDGGCSSFEGCGSSDGGCSNTDGCGSSDESSCGSSSSGCGD